VPLRFTIEGDWPATRAVFAGLDAAGGVRSEAPGSMPEPDTLEVVRGWLEECGPAAASRVCAGTKLPYQVVRTALQVLHDARMVSLAAGGGWQATRARDEVA